MHFKKTWNDEFEYLLGCSQSDIDSCYRELYKFYIASFPSKSSEGKKSEAPKEDSEKLKRNAHVGSTSRANANDNKQRSNSIKGHLCTIEMKGPHHSKPRNHTKRVDSSQRSIEKSSIPRITTANSGILRTLKDVSSNCNITTPDKPMITTLKSSSSNKSSIKRFKPAILQKNRVPRPILYDSSQKRPKLLSRNQKGDSMLPSRNEFKTSNSTLKVACSYKSR